MDSNALPGWTNRVLARFVDRAAVSFAEALPHFRGKGVLTGNPVRSEFFEVPAKTHDGAQFSLLVFGGSQGARAINEAMIAALPLLESVKDRLRVMHQTGKADFERVRDGYAAARWSEQAEVRPYIDDMVSEFGEADLIISRAGATTTAELVAAGKAAIMIPFPLAADDHQRRNAEALQSAGAARMILQRELTAERLANEIKAVVAAPEKISEMETAGRQLARRDAAEATVDLMEELVKSGRQ
jgi:UDP-N-acetylglucosamine--N-acetylmuramyl-(pentapeptide) pyrophosphoryl-undecaprenol N-acetylglucosamine transferase